MDSVSSHIRVGTTFMVKEDNLKKSTTDVIFYFFLLQKSLFFSFVTHCHNFYIYCSQHFNFSWYQCGEELQKYFSFFRNPLKDFFILDIRKLKDEKENF
jgi:hypothetical protein